MKYYVSDGTTTGEYEAESFDELTDNLYGQCGDLNGAITVFHATADDGETCRWIWWRADDDQLHVCEPGDLPHDALDAWCAQRA